MMGGTLRPLRSVGFDRNFRNNCYSAALLRVIQLNTDPLLQKMGRTIWYHLFLRGPICFLKSLRLQERTLEIALWVTLILWEYVSDKFLQSRVVKFKQFFCTNSFWSLKHYQSAVVLFLANQTLQSKWESSSSWLIASLCPLMASVHCQGNYTRLVCNANWWQAHCIYLYCLCYCFCSLL